MVKSLNGRAPPDAINIPVMHPRVRALQEHLVIVKLAFIWRASVL